MAAGGKFANGAVTGAFSYAFSATFKSHAQPQALSYETVQGPDYWEDGSYDWRVKWSLSKPSKNGGWIVQEIKTTIQAIGFDGAEMSQQAHFWEAWRVDAGETKTTSYLPYDDKFSADTKGTAASIRISVSGSARFYEGLRLPNSFRPNSVNFAGSLPATALNPNLPLRQATQPVSRLFEHKWP